MLLRLTSARRDERAFLLIDALIAMTFFAIVLGAWATMTNMKSRVIAETDRRFRATQAAQSALARARDGDLKPGKFQVDSMGSLSGSDLPGVLEGELKLDPREDGLKEMTVIVSWMEPGRSQESVRIATLVK